jgi:hypothetical protein
MTCNSSTFEIIFYDNMFTLLAYFFYLLGVVRCPVYLLGVVRCPVYLLGVVRCPVYLSAYFLIIYMFGRV